MGTSAGAADLASAAQRTAGMIAARHRGDQEGWAALYASFPDEGALAGGAVLLADLLMALYSQQTGQSVDECVRELSLQIDQATVGPRR